MNGNPTDYTDYMDHRFSAQEYLSSGIDVTLHEVLNAREARADRQATMLQTGKSLISFTLNIPGPVKRFPLSVKTFEIGRCEIENQLRRYQIAVSGFTFTDQKTGTEGLWSVAADAAALKSLMVVIDEGHPLGRLFDIDVIGADGGKISRESVGSEVRRCLICRNPASACAGRRVHGVEELVEATVQLMTRYLTDTFCAFVSATAVKSLLYEVCVTPKPGLVDSANNGAHQDMDKFSFLNSASVLGPYFKRITMQAQDCRKNGMAPQEVLRTLRYMGLMAEEDMYRATGGANTHKGVIYSMGILCAAYGYSYDCGGIATTTAPAMVEIETLRLCSQIAAPLPAEETAQVRQAGQPGAFLSEQARQHPTTVTNGERAYLEHGMGGVRGEVSNGFPSVQKHGLPALRKKLEEGWNINTACLWALLNLMANIDDTNVLARSNAATQARIRHKIWDIVQDQALSPADVVRACTALDAEFIESNISPGGAADLLSVTLMLHFMEQESDFLSNPAV